MADKQIDEALEAVDRIKGTLMANMIPGAMDCDTIRQALERQREGFTERQIFDRAINMLNDMHNSIGFSDVHRMKLDTRLADKIAQKHMQRLQDDLLAAPEESDD